MYLVYSVLLAVGFLLAAPWYLWKGRRSGKYVQTFRERMGRLPAHLDAECRPVVWIHAVSVGEVIAARSLIGPLKERLPGHKVFLSTTTVTGNALARATAHGIDGLFFAPFDWGGPVARVLDRLKPSLLVLVETELWPNLIHAAHERGVRIAVVNGRISPRSFPRYQKIRAFLAPVLGEIDVFLMQAESHAQRIRALGAPAARVRVSGNLKFDARTARPGETLSGIVLDDRRRARPIWIAGSTVEGEEALVLEAFAVVLGRVPDTRLVIAPRHPERFDAVAAAIAAAGFGCGRRSLLTPGGWLDHDVLLLDSIGELADLYPVCTVAFVGGSLVPAGGHNVLEAAAAGKAVVVGPYMQNFQEIRDQFAAEGALVEVRTAAELGEAVAQLITDDARRQDVGNRAQALIERNRGAVTRTVEALAGLMA